MNEKSETPLVSDPEQAKKLEDAVAALEEKAKALAKNIWTRRGWLLVCRDWVRTRWRWGPAVEVLFDYQHVLNIWRRYAVKHLALTEGKPPLQDTSYIEDESYLVTARALLYRAKLSFYAGAGWSLVNQADSECAKVSFSEFSIHYNRYRAWEGDLNHALENYHGAVYAKERRVQREQLAEDVKRLSSEPPEIARKSERVRKAWLCLLDAHRYDWHLANNRGYYTVRLAKRVAWSMTISVLAGTGIVTYLLMANGSDGWERYAGFLSMIMGVFGASVSVLIRSRSKTTSAVTYRTSVVEIPLRLALGGAAGLVTFMVLFQNLDFSGAKLGMARLLMAFGSGFSEKLALEQVINLVRRGGRSDETGKS